MLIEVSGSSKAFARGEKLRLYAQARIVEYWIVDVAGQTVEVFTDPKSSQYEKSSLYKVGDQVNPRCLPTAILNVDRLFSNTVQ